MSHYFIYNEFLKAVNSTMIMHCFHIPQVFYIYWYSLETVYVLSEFSKSSLNIWQEIHIPGMQLLGALSNDNLTPMCVKEHPGGSAFGVWANSWFPLLLSWNMSGGVKWLLFKAGKRFWQTDVPASCQVSLMTWPTSPASCWDASSTLGFS